MKIAPVHDAGSAWHVSFNCQWPEWFRRDMNWRNFNLIGFAVESGSYKGRYVEISISLLGICVDVEWCDRLTRSAWMSEIEQDVQGVRDMIREEEPEE